MRTPNVNPSVRRRLFSEHETCEEDNWLNSMLLEVYDADTERLRTRWNFDPETDLPLDGPIKWVKTDGSYDWIGTVKLDEAKIENNDLEGNEKTPRKERSVSAPPLKKRKIIKDTSDLAKSAKRRLSFP